MTPPTILCLASYFKGHCFLTHGRRLGWHVVLLTVESLLGDDWPRQEIDEVFALPTFTDERALLNAVSFLARTRRIARVVALDDFDVEVAAAVREHLRLPGLSASSARFFRDKLAMRVRARNQRHPQPKVCRHLLSRRYWRFSGQCAPAVVAQTAITSIGGRHSQAVGCRGRLALSTPWAMTNRTTFWNNSLPVTCTMSIRS